MKSSSATSPSPKPAGRSRPIVDRGSGYLSAHRSRYLNAWDRFIEGLRKAGMRQLRPSPLRRVGVWRGGFRLSMSVAAPFVWR